LLILYFFHLCPLLSLLWSLGLGIDHQTKLVFPPAWLVRAIDHRLPRRRQKIRPAKGCSRAGAGMCLIEKKKDEKIKKKDEENS
jgi:hypothetical protein